MPRALAVFAKTPFPGTVKTRMIPYLDPEEGADLYRCMLLDTLQRLRGLRVKTFLFFEGEEGFFRQVAAEEELVRQHPGGLGERLEHAFVLMAEKGFPLRAAIGSDAPDLPLSYLEEAFRQLRQGKDAVFGPAEDGGYYLVGLSGATCGLFRDIPWSSSAVLETSLTRAAEGALSTSLLPSWYDVDSFEDLSRPGLSDPENGAPLTRRFIENLFLQRRQSGNSAG